MLCRTIKVRINKKFLSKVLQNAEIRYIIYSPYGDVKASTARGLRRKAGGRVDYLKTQKALIANKNENAKTIKFAAPVAAPAMALAA